MKSLQTTILGVLILQFFLLVACRTPVNLELTGTYETLKSICNNPDKYLNKEIQLKGTFSGWEVGNCKFVPNYAHQIMRSDWIFSDVDSNCIYVTAGKPDFLDPLREEDIGKEIQLKAKLLKNSQNKFYFEYVKAYISAPNY